MTAAEPATDGVSLSVENIGGIDETSLSLPPGVSVLTGKNATNRTSLLQAIMAALGSDQATLKGDAEEGHVRLTIDGETCDRTLRRTGTTVQFEGDGYLADATAAELFAFLLESNEARRSVARGDNLRELIMRPVDIEEIRSEIAELESEKAEINDRLAEIESRRDELPALEQEKRHIQEEISEKREQLAAKEEELESKNTDVKEGLRNHEELEEKLAELRDIRGELDSIRTQIDRQKESIASLKRERADLEAERDEVTGAPPDDHPDLEARIADLRDERQQLNAEISELQNLIQYNREQLTDGGTDVLQPLDEGDGDEATAVTDQLLPEESESVVCWTCGSTVEREQIEHTIDRLETLRDEKAAELSEVKADLDALKTDKREAEQARQRREEIESQLEDIAAELEQREAQVASLQQRRADLTDEIERLEAAVDELESEELDDVLTLHREANELEFEIDGLEADLEEVTEEIEAIDALTDEAEELRDTREALVADLTDKRTKIDQIESSAVESFNDHMESVLDVLEYENLERIWIDRVERTVREGRQRVDQTAFELHIVRTTENGTAYEDTVDHLSESEREVTGLIFALAGYLVHDLHETVPFMLLDSLEAIDSGRIAALVDYFAEYAAYLVVALLPEDAQALSDEYHYVTDI